MHKVQSFQEWFLCFIRMMPKVDSGPMAGKCRRQVKAQPIDINAG